MAVSAERALEIGVRSYTADQRAKLKQRAPVPPVASKPRDLGARRSSAAVAQKSPGAPHYRPRSSSTSLQLPRAPSALLIVQDVLGCRLPDADLGSLVRRDLGHHLRQERLEELDQG